MTRVEKSAKWIVGMVLLVLLGFVAWSVFFQPGEATKLRLGDGVFTADIARTEEQRQRGLGGRRELPPSRAMLLVYDSSAAWGIWMQDMHIDIDIIWLDADKRVVHIVKNASPDTYPQIFSPDKPARYVLEVPAGTVEDRSIVIGQQAHFELPKK